MRWLSEAVTPRAARQGVWSAGRRMSKCAFSRA
jgi:hypothetical protein